MTSLKYLRLFFLFLIATVIGLSSCSDDEPTFNSETKQIKLYLTDDPLDAEEVNVEVIQVILIGEDGEQIELNTLAGVYDLLKLTGDSDTLLATGNFDLDHIIGIAIILGDDNTIVVDGVTHPLEVDEDDKFILLELFWDVGEGFSPNILVDFDACKSIKKVNGDYTLKPFLRFKGNRDHKTIDESVIVALDSCFQVVFPVEAINKKDEEISVGNMAELLDLFASEEIFGVTYPVEVVDHNKGEIIKVTNGNKAERLLEDCSLGQIRVDVHKALDDLLKCFDVEFPIEVVDLRGNSHMVFTFEDALTLPDLIDFKYPFTVTRGEDFSEKIDDLEDLYDIIKDCEQGGGGPNYEVIAILLSLDFCYEIQYPLELLHADSAVYAYSSIEDLWNATELPTSFIYPFFLKDTEGEIIEVDDIEEAFELIEECAEHYCPIADEDLLEDFLDCFEIVYPITVIGEDSVSIEIVNLEDLLSLDKEIVGVMLPIRVIDKDGNEHLIESEADFEPLLSLCLEDSEVSFTSKVWEVVHCYGLVYPLELNVAGDSVKVIIENAEGLFTALDNHPVSEFVYPITIVNSAGEERMVIRQELDELLETCISDENNLLTWIDRCYNFDFPVRIKGIGPGVEVAHDMKELEEIWEQDSTSHFHFPVFLIDEDGKRVRIKNNTELFDALKNCQ